MSEQSVENDFDDDEISEPQEEEEWGKAYKDDGKGKNLSRKTSQDVVEVMTGVSVMLHSVLLSR